MKLPCFDKYERYELKIKHPRMKQRYKAIKAGRDLERKIEKDLDKLFTPIIHCISKIITNLTPKSSHNEKI